MSAPLTPDDRLGLKILGTRLAAEGRWGEAIRPLEAALALYREAARSGDSALAMRDGDLIDQATVLGYLLACYYVLGGPGSTAAQPIPGDDQPARDSYQDILERLEEAADTWYWLGAEAFSLRRAYGILQDCVAEQAGLLDLLHATGSMAAAVGEAASSQLPLSDEQRTSLGHLDRLWRELAARLATRLDDLRRLVSPLSERQTDAGHVLEAIRRHMVALRLSLSEVDAQATRACVEFYDGYGPLGDALARIPGGLTASAGPPGGARSLTPLDEQLARKFDVLERSSSVEEYLASRPLLHELDDEAAIAALGQVREEGASLQAAIDGEVARLFAAADDVPQTVRELFDVHLGLRILLTTIATSLEGTDQLTRQALAVADARSAEVVQAAADLGGWLERWRARLVTDAEKILALERGQPFFLRWVTTLLRLGAPAEALVASETARARAFADLLSAGSPVGLATSPQGPGAGEFRLASLASAPPVSLQDVFGTVHDPQATVFSGLSPGSPALGRLVDARESTSEASAMTARRVILVEYFTVEDGFLLFGVRVNLSRPEVVHVPLDHEQLRGFVISNFGEHDKVWELLAAGLVDELWHEAYDPLIAPIGRWAAPEDIVYLVPHGFLHYLPLHALRLEGRYLTERNPVLYGPSASVLRFCQQRRKNGPGGRPARATAAVFGDALGDLPFARTEAERVAALFGVVPQLGDQATIEAFRSGSAGVDVVHVAGHARFDAAQPLESGLRLARDRLLTARELFSLQGLLHAHLVTLSGCETGVNERRPGDELIGLTRALLYAGTPSVLVSLWRVADDSTAFLMERFYSLLRTHPDMFKVDALRWAMLETKAQPGWESFHHWAPFVLVGDWQ